MAEVDESFVWPEKLRKSNRKYPWEKWLDGQTWKLTKDEDFNCAARNFRQMAVQAALRLEMDGTVLAYVDGDVVWIKFEKKEK